jgi:predicted PurR-regulated permease PerM
MNPVAVLVVVMLGGAVAGVMGAIFAIPTAAAFLAITDYLRGRTKTKPTDDAAAAAADDPAPALVLDPPADATVAAN